MMNEIMNAKSLKEVIQKPGLRYIETPQKQYFVNMTQVTQKDGKVFIQYKKGFEVYDGKSRFLDAGIIAITPQNGGDAYFLWELDDIKKIAKEKDIDLSELIDA